MIRFGENDQRIREAGNRQIHGNLDAIVTGQLNGILSTRPGSTMIMVSYETE